LTRYQEKQAADVVSKLKGDIALTARVVRNGQETEIRARELVPGDILVVEEGTVVPADAHLICDYDDKLEGFSHYRAEMSVRDMGHESGSEKKDEEDEDHGVQLGHAVLAVDSPP